MTQKTVKINAVIDYKDGEDTIEKIELQVGDVLYLMLWCTSI